MGFTINAASVNGAVSPTAPAAPAPLTPVWPTTDYGNNLVGEFFAGAPFTFEFKATGATSYKLVSGTLPTGVTYDAVTSTFSGLENSAGPYPKSYNLTLRATNAEGSVDRVIRLEFLRP